MTRQEKTRKRNTRFSSWIRNNLPDSKTGFIVYDVDFIFSNYITKKIMIIEEKINNGEVSFGQKLFLKRLDVIFQNGCKHIGYEYLGYYTIVFQNDSFDNGSTYIIQNKVSDKKHLITENEFIKFINKNLQNDTNN